MKDELGGKVMATVRTLRAQTYSYLVDDGSEDKKARSTQKCVIKRKIKFENYKNCLEGNQLHNKINYLEKKVTVDSSFCYKKLKEFIRNNKLLLKTQQTFKTKRHNVFTK